MRSPPHLPENHDLQVEWFHVLAEEVQANKARATEGNLRDDFAKFVAYHVPGHIFPLSLTNDEFAEAVVSLRANECAWNRSLMTTIIAASAQAESGQPSEAVEHLRAFASVCPWVVFAKVATNHASSISTT